MLGTLFCAVHFGGAISVENPGIRLELFLKDLSRQAGQEFRCPTSLNNEVLAASFHDQSIDIVKAQLANVIHGTWEKKEGDWWLTQSSEQKKEEAKWNRDQRMALYRWLIDSLQKEVPKSEWTVAEFEKVWNVAKAPDTLPIANIKAGRFRAMMLQPESRFEARVASLLKPEYFYTDGLHHDNGRYSPRGLPGHLSLPIDIADSLTAFQNESQIYSTVTGQPNRSVRTPAHVEITNRDLGLPRFTMYIYDQRWGYISSCWLAIDLDSSSVVAEGEAFSLSEATKKRIDFYDLLQENRYDRNEDSNMRADPEFAPCRDAMLTATKTDPLGLRQGLCWIDFAKSVHQPLLVNLEEDAYQYRPKLFVPKREQQGIKLGMERVDKDGWVLGRPLNPLANRTWRVDRSLVERFSRLVYSPDFLSLKSQIQVDDLLIYSYLNSAGFPNEAFYVGFDYRGNGPFCLLGTLTPEQLGACINGDRIPVERLSERAQQYLTQLWSNGNLNDLSPLMSDPFASSPIYCLPNGYKGTTLGVSQTDVPVFTTSTDPNAPGTTLGAFAGFIYRGQRSDPANLDKPFQTWRERALTAEVHLGTRVLTQTVSEPGIAERHTYTWKTAPESIRKAVLDTIKGWGTIR